MKRALLFLLLLSTSQLFAGGITVTMVPATGTKKVYLIQVNNGVQTLMDSATTTSSQCVFGNQPGGYYSLKVIYQSDPNHLPTYYGDVAFWDQADSSSLGSTAIDSIFATVNAISAATLSGPASIQGSITQGNAKIAAFGDPISNVEVLLLDNSNTPLAYTYTDASGNYQFSNLPYGTYKIYGEVINKSNPNPPTVTLDSGTPAKTGVDVWVNSNGVAQPSSTTGVISSMKETHRFYPNPTKDVLKVELNGSVGEIQVLNSVGTVVMSRKAGLNNDVNLSSFPSGIYYLKVINTDGTATLERIVKE